MNRSYSSQTLNSLYHQIGVAVIVVDLQDGEIFFVNEHVVSDLDRTLDDIHGKRYDEVFSQEFLSFYRTLADECLDGNEHTAIYYWTERSLWEQISGKRILWEGKEAMLLTITNVNEVTRSDYDYKQLAFFDSVTGLPNERKLEEDINEIAHHESINLVFFTVENLYDVYDLYGWATGDALLLSIRDWLKRTKLKRTHLYRLDNVFIMMGRDINKTHLFCRAQVVRERFIRPWVVPYNEMDISLYCRARTGIVFGQYARNEMSNIIMRTLKMARDNDAGIAVYDKETDEAVKRRNRLRSEVIDCMYEGMENFSVMYHPIVAVESGKWVGAEALCRWRSRTLGDISPGEFIPFVEQAGFITYLDAWVRSEAIRECSKIGLNKKNFLLDINFSPHQALDGCFVENIVEVAQRADFPLDHLIVEITETERFTFDEQSLDGLNKLKATGVMVSLDDFGTGYSSLENLIKISAGMMKTDKMLVDDLENDPSRQLLLETLIRTAHDLGMKIVVEGVERESQQKIIASLKADYIQGYLYSKPLTIAQLKAKTNNYTNKP